MNVARAELYGFFQQIVDRANHGRAAGKVPQTFDIVFTRLKQFAAAPRLGRVVAQSTIENNGKIFDRCHFDRDIAPEHDFGCAPCRRIGRIRDRQYRASVGGLIGKHHHFP